MIAGTQIEPIAPDDLRETCPTCQGTGLEPLPANHAVGGAGRQLLVRQAKCPHRLCRNGKIPSANGKAILKLLQDYDRVTILD